MSLWRKLLIGKWSWSRPLKSIASIYIIIAAVAWFIPEKILFHPPPSNYSDGENGYSSITNSNNQKVGIFYQPAKQNMPTILWSHGNGEDIGLLYHLFVNFSYQGFGILAYDYPGYGISEGKPTEPGCHENAAASWEHLTHDLKIDPENIIIYGQSVGGGPATQLASEKNSAGLILVSPFTSAFRVATRIPLFAGDLFKNLELISDVHEPLLIIHGEKDKVIPSSHGKKLHQLHTGEKTLLTFDESGHNDIYYYEEKAIIQAIVDFHQKNKSTKVQSDQSLTSKKSNKTAR